MPRIDNVIYTGKTYTTGGRDGTARSDDGRLNVKLTGPGSKGDGTNPEQLFGAGWSACFLSAIEIAARELRVALPAGAAVNAEVDLGSGAGGYGLQARLKVSLPGLDGKTAQALIDTAHQTCPYSKSTRGNVDVAITLA